MLQTIEPYNSVGINTKILVYKNANVDHKTCYGSYLPYVLTQSHLKVEGFGLLIHAFA